MLKRISYDKEKLRSTVRSLEKANFDLKQAQKEIIRAEKLASVGRLSAGIAHEIGNPIGIIIGYLDLLKQKDIKDKEKNEFITRTEKEINRINTIIRQLLDFSRPSKEGMKAVSAHEIIKDVLNVINVQPFLSNINLELSLKAEKDIIHADPNQLRQVFLNLMINAADAVSSSEASQDGKIIIKSEVVSGSDFDFKDQETLLKLMFIDNGVGVPKETLGNIFDPFYTTKEPGKGTGLGLSVSFMIIESMGGTIKATSEQSKGTTLIIYLPFYEEAK
jgi:signal transduction histidine kinase